jgi:hypothetical protein
MAYQVCPAGFEAFADDHITSMTVILSVELTSLLGVHSTCLDKRSRYVPFFIRFCLNISSSAFLSRASIEQGIDGS